jgi:hypothetical protein
MKGIIERIYPNKLQDGREYLTLQISGGKYSLWDKKHFGELDEGMPVDFKFKASGKYLNISEIEEDPDYKPENGGNNNPFNYPNHRDLQILKTSCLKCATYLTKDISVGLEKRLDLTLDVAKRFEKYLTVMPNQEQSPLPEELGDPGNFDGEF